MYIPSLDEGQVNFKSLEKYIYNEVCHQACTILSDVLKNLDMKLMAERDKKRYRAKGIKHTCLKTIMGPVEYGGSEKAFEDHLWGSFSSQRGLVLPAFCRIPYLVTWDSYFTYLVL